MSSLLPLALDSIYQRYTSGGGHTAPEARLLLYSLCVALRAKEVLELGFDQGYSAAAMAASGAHVVGVDQVLSQMAQETVAKFPNCELLVKDAKAYLQEVADDFYDLVFVDDDHDKRHVRWEAETLRTKVKSGGVIVFHDPVFHPHIWEIIEMVYPDWQRICLPAITPISGQDMGLGLVRKP